MTSPSSSCSLASSMYHLHQDGEWIFSALQQSNIYIFSMFLVLYFLFQRDPNLWTVKCKVWSLYFCVGRHPKVQHTIILFSPMSCNIILPLQIGEERATAIALMRKFIAYQFTDTVCPRPHSLHGYVPCIKMLMFAFNVLYD